MERNDIDVRLMDMWLDKIERHKELREKDEHRLMPDCFCGGEEAPNGRIIKHKMKQETKP